MNVLHLIIIILFSILPKNYIKKMKFFEKIETEKDERSVEETYINIIYIPNTIFLKMFKETQMRSIRYIVNFNRSTLLFRSIVQR